MAATCLARADDTFGPVVASGCRDGFDFTLLFEQTILGILPTSIFGIAAALRLIYLLRKRHQTKTRAGASRYLKLAIASALAVLQIPLLVYWTQTQPLDRTRASVPVAGLSFVVALQLLALTWVEDVRAIRPSALSSAYLLSSAVFNSAQVRTLYLQGASRTTPAALNTADVVLRVLLLVVESRRKTASLKAPYQSLPPEEISGVINRSFLWWINDLFANGLRSQLSSDALYVLDHKLTSVVLEDRIEKAWTGRKRPERRFEYPWAACRALRRSLLLVFVPRLCMIGFTFAQPFLITRALNLLTQPENVQTSNEGYGLIGATGLIYLGLAVSTLHYNQNLYRFITMFRGMTVAMIYNHALTISVDAHDASGALTLMSTDVDRIILCLVELNECWARTIEVIMGTALLALQLGWVCVTPILVVIVSFFGAAQISRTIGARQKIWVDAVQKRISTTTSVLAGMKSVKMLGLSRILTRLIQDERVEETNRMAHFRWSIVAQNMVQNLPWFVAPAMTFVIFAAQAIARGQPSIQTTQAFTALSLITLLTNPAAKLLSAIVSTAASTGCFERVQAFLLSKKRAGERTLADPSASPMSVTDTTSLDPQGVEMTRLQHNDMRQMQDGSTALSVKHLALRPAASTSILFEDVDFSIATKTLTMIVGSVASGKSTLLRALLGEISPDHGVIKISSQKVAYAAQTPWLPNTSIRDAITGPIASSAKFDYDWYSKTLHACALVHDMATLQHGDQTLVGDASTSLSGGQKHRIALARAVYSRFPIMILDDVLGALDTNTQTTVMERLFGQAGLLRSLGTTVVLVTHATRFLHYADKVLFVAKGQVVDAGKCGQTKIDLANALRSIDDTGPQLDTASSSNGVKEKAAQIAKTNQKQDLARATGDFGLYRYYFSSVGLFASAVFVGFVIVNVFCNSFGQIWLNRWTAIDGGQIPLYMSVYLVLAVFAVIGMGGYVYAILILIGPSTAREFHARLLNVVMRAPQSFFSTTDNGSILNRFSQDMSLIEGQLPTGVLITVSNLFACIAGAALVATGSSYMAISIPFLAAAIWAIQHVYLRTSRQLRLLDLEARSPLFSHFMESLTGLTTIRAFGWEQAFKERNHERLDHSQRPYYLLYCIQRWLNLVLDLIVGAEAVLVVGLAVSLRGSTSVGLLGVSLNNILSFSATLSSLVSGWTMLETSLGSIARLRDFEATVNPEDAGHAGREPPLNWPGAGGIDFQSVTAAHGNGTVGITDLSLNIKAGQKVGVCGRTGSGKSSMISTLLRLLEIKSGTILTDNVDITTLSSDTIRERLYVVPQEPLILTESLRVNLDPSGKCLDDEIMRNALARVGLDQALLVDDASRTSGLEDKISASALSSGQQQLLALARLLVKKELVILASAPQSQQRQGGILLLDEPTSNIDHDAEMVLQKVVKEEFVDFTVISVAHRLETIMDVDVVLVMDGGRVVESGSPDELMRVEGGKFRGLVTAGSGA